MAIDVQGLDMRFEIRTPAGPANTPAAGPWLELVCAVDDNVELDNEVSETDTRCGTFTATKKPKGTMSGNAVASSSLTSAQASYAVVSEAQEQNTLYDFRYYNAANTGSGITIGSVVSIQGQGRFTNTSLSGSTGESVQFSWTFSPTGTLLINSAITG